MNRYYTPINILLVCVSIIAICSCKGNAPSDEDTAVQSQTPVTVATVSNSALADSIELNATSLFLQKNYVSANAIGYITKVNVQPGHYVQKGQLMFTLKTKEAQSIGNTINVLDTTFKFSGINKIKASRSGYVTQLLHQVGDYVQDGQQLAIISDRESFAFVLQLPYELRGVIPGNQNLMLTLPDGEKLNGHIASLMPSVDTLSQTQGIVIKVNNTHPIPENLVAKATIIKTAKSSAPSLPKSAVLSNETQREFWVMKLINDTTAIKTAIRKGIESGGRIEILAPAFKPADRVIVTGNYGLADTAKVKIVK
ncbi:HlyD family efflux transporter periplasmic adaptor subunit [Mucilaginibacter achroorhodeus]|uniref:HlyD family efflux transporter periplasmic adaptor subunit n=1 Tax=Mucilaginibacter achroorhodeus TaxID=2599294 RepID=A0A563TYF6_9SPHI|nr:efflux RND transporter periplasmic adaptor subunit [Mucilaginibacter achroorhodeus]TWR24160.1 HlyD family efflux transporter periplasmic adaptor subunit [Mucilaginibacter achroorhodeus]